VAFGVYRLDSVSMLVAVGVAIDGCIKGMTVGLAVTLKLFWLVY